MTAVENADSVQVTTNSCGQISRDRNQDSPLVEELKLDSQRVIA